MIPMSSYWNPASSFIRSTMATGFRPAHLEELRQDLRAVTMKCRPDWDITTPELKAAWRRPQGTVLSLRQNLRPNYR